MSQKLPLSGIRVLDFTWVGAGPITTALLAEYGAEVIKIESGTRLDTLRLLPPYKDGKVGSERSGYFSNRNPNKKGISLNMKNPRAFEIIKELIKKSDIVCDNFTAHAMEKWGLGYGDVRKIKPDIIYACMPLMGTDGPHVKYRGFGVQVNSIIGILHLTGFPEKEPFGMGTNYPDHVANPMQTAFAILAALRHKRKTGEGQYIELCQIEAPLCILPTSVMDYMMNGRVENRQGNQHFDFAPHGIYPVLGNNLLGNNHWIVLSVQSEDEWQSLKAAMGMPEWAEQAKFTANAERMANQAELNGLIAGWTVNYDGDELLRRLVKAKVRAGLVKDARDVLNDPQLNYRKHFVYLDHSEMGYNVYNNSPVHMSKTPAVLDQAAPLLGEHTKQVMQDLLNMDETTFEELKKQGVFD
ncbi:MAG: succinyl-CoA--benzylsuccinate CoA-transferase [Desulfosporosinus sp. BRH_c37]|nr:MAG: succinyl-CoA--benzylsuccinate CoA-transferase [Desulfosporosinus sp. BRH_c37]